MQSQSTAQFEPILHETMDSLSLAANILGVVGSCDIVFRAVSDLHHILGQVKSAQGTAEQLLGVLNGLAVAISNVRDWAAAYDHSQFAQKDGQAVPQELLPLLDGCLKEVNALKAITQKAIASNHAVRRLLAGFQFALREARVQQSMSRLQSYAQSFILLVQTRTGYVFLLLRKGHG